MGEIYWTDVTIGTSMSIRRQSNDNSDNKY